MKIIKRNGSEEIFDVSKVEAAVEKRMPHPIMHLLAGSR